MSFEKKVRSLRQKRDDEVAGGRDDDAPTRRELRPARPASPAPKVYRPPRRLAWRIFKWTCVAAFVGAAVGVGALAALFYIHGRSLPQLDNLSQYDPPTVTRIYARGGELIAELAEDNGYRTFLPLQRIPRHVIDAVLAAEDAEFRTHEGLDYWGMVRAFFVNLTHGHFKQGGSTITQQVVKTMILTADKTIARKVKEVILARRLEQKLSKDEILTLYLNQIYFGHRRHGIEEAARFYFGKSATDVTLGEAAVLAGLIKSPGRFSPRLHPRAAKGRQREVLASLRKASQAGKLSRVYSEGEVRRAMETPLVVWHPREVWLGRAPYYADLVRQRVQAMVGDKAFFRGNLKVETACDVRLQAAAERALRSGLARIDRRRGWRGATKRLPAREIDAFKAALAKDGREVVAGEVYRAVVTRVEPASVRVSLGAMDAVLPAQHAAWALGGTKRRGRARVARKSFGAIVQVGDVVHVRVVSLGAAKGGQTGEVVAALEQLPETQGALVVIDPQTRDVLALVGGYDFAKSPFNRAVKAQRQPGSSFKPIVYSAAVRTKRYTPSTIVIDSPAVYGPIFSRHAYRPQNYDRRYRGPVRLRSALGQSLNLVAVKVADDIGIEAVRQEAKVLGIESPISKNLAVALGADSVTPLELANAYAVFASGGKLETPKVVRRVLKGDGTQVLPQVAPAQHVMTPEHAFVMTSLLRAPIEDPKGTARRAARVGHLVAGKTGTTNKHIDAWFVGYTPQLLAAVWVGHDDRAPLGGRATGGHVAVPIWLDFMAPAMAGKPRNDFGRPLGIEVARVDPQTGMRAAAGQVDAVEEVFVGGTAPRDEAPRPGQASSPETLLLDDGANAAPSGSPRSPPQGGAPVSPRPPSSPAPLPAATDRTPTSAGH